MKTNDLVFMSLLVSVGAVLHAIVPGFVFGMKPDMLLVVMVLGIVLYPKFTNVMMLGITTGVISALTTTFPAGQIPNMVDKIITSLILFGIVYLLKRLKWKIIKIGILASFGTIVSGSIFLSSALFLSGLPAPFVVLFLTVVLPTTVINTVTILVLFPVLNKIIQTE